jgi:hypothetical protein
MLVAFKTQRQPTKAQRQPTDLFLGPLKAQRIRAGAASNLCKPALLLLH